MSDRETFKKLAGEYFCPNARRFDELVKDFADTFAAGRVRAEKEIEALCLRARELRHATAEEIEQYQAKQRQEKST